jgi:hypothetical protein
MDDLVEHFSAELRSVLMRVLKEEAPEVDVDRIFEAFKREVKSSLGRASVTDSDTLAQRVAL